jgi:serine/threonine-protein phosphatase 2A regulatory subunit B
LYLLSLLVLVFEYEDDEADKSFFSEIISSISDVKFTQNGEQIISRDFFTLKLWDIRNESKPLCVRPIHPALNDKLCDLYENDCIFDKFECAASPLGKYPFFSSSSSSSSSWVCHVEHCMVVPHTGNSDTVITMCVAR